MTSETGLDRPHVFLPAEPSADGPPLLLLHGTGGDEHDLLPLRDSLSPGGAVLSVRGTVVENGMNRFFRRVREGVFDEADLQRRAEDLAVFVANAGVAYGIRPGSLVAVGFSNGSNIASELLFRQPVTLAAAVLFAAMVPRTDPPPADLSGKLVIVSNGERDPMIPATMTRELVGQFRTHGAEVVELPHSGGHQIHPAALGAAADKLATTFARHE